MDVLFFEQQRGGKKYSKGVGKEICAELVRLKVRNLFIHQRPYT